MPNLALDEGVVAQTKDGDGDIIVVLTKIICDPFVFSFTKTFFAHPLSEFCRPY